MNDVNDVRVGALSSSARGKPVDLTARCDERLKFANGLMSSYCNEYCNVKPIQFITKMRKSMKII